MLPVLILLGLGIFLVVAGLYRNPFKISGHWQNFLDGIRLQSDQFYEQVRAELKAREINHVDVTEEKFLEVHILSGRRIYLRVKQNEHLVYICAVQYGTGTYVSSWQCIKHETLLNRIRVINKLLGKDRSNKTFYQMDAEAMFYLAVHTSLMNSIDTMTSTSGHRLTELERQVKPYNDGKIV